MINKINDGSEFVFCSRYMDGNESEDDTIIRKFGNYFFTKIVNILFKINSTDVLFLYVLGKSILQCCEDLHDIPATACYCCYD